MIRIFTFLIVCFSLQMSAQTTITLASLPEVGDTLRTSIDNTPDVDLGSTGQNTWDFSSLSGNINRVLVFENPDLGSSLNFSNADLMTRANGSETYFSFQNNRLVELGTFGNDPILGTAVINSKYSDPLIIQQYPLNFEDQYNQNTSLLVPISTDLIPDSLLDGLPVRPDSLRLRIDIRSEHNVDAYGDLQLPMEQYEVLREHRFETRTFFYDAFVPLVGWLDITSAAVELIPQLNLPPDTINEYLFYSDGFKSPIASVGVDADSNPVSVQYINEEDPSNTVSEVIDAVNIHALPNPSIGLLEFKIDNAKSGLYTIGVRNIVGQLLWKKEFIVNGRQSRFRVDLTHLRHGSYFYTLYDKNGNAIATKRLVFIRA